MLCDMPVVMFHMHCLRSVYETRCGDMYSEYVQCLDDMAIKATRG